MAFQPFFARPNSIGSFKELCDIVESGRETKRSPYDRTILIVDESGSEAQYDVDFTLGIDDRTELRRRITAFLMRGRNRDKMTVFEQQSYREESVELYKVIKAYAHCLSGTEEVFDGFCEDCLKPAKIELGDRETMVHCKECRKTPFSP